MIAVDTNALLRWLLADMLPADDAPQVAAITDTLRKESVPVFVGTVVMAEMVWVLRSRGKLDRQQIATVVDHVLKDTRVIVEHAAAFQSAVAAFADGGPGFVDHLIGQIARASGARTTLTFDRTASRLDTFTLLAAGA